MLPIGFLLCHQFIQAWHLFWTFPISRQTSNIRQRQRTCRLSILCSPRICGMLRHFALNTVVWKLFVLQSLPVPCPSLLVKKRAWAPKCPQWKNKHAKLCNAHHYRICFNIPDCTMQLLWHFYDVPAYPYNLDLWNARYSFIYIYI